VQWHCSPEKTIANRYSPFTAVLPVANHQSPFAVHYSPFAIRYSLSFLARQEPRTPMMSPTKVGAQFLRYQLRTGVRSMNGHGGEVFNTKSQMRLWNTLSEVIEQLWLNVCSFWEWL
jgi:hypothetical protein